MALDTPQRAPVRVRAARNAVYLAFFACGVGFSTWASRLPDIKAHLDLTPGQLGLLLFGSAAGSIVALPSAGAVIRRLGTTRTVQLGMALFSLGIIGAGVGVDVVRNPFAVVPGMFVVGLGMGVWDVAMNHEGADVERHLRRTIMPWFHAAFSGATVVSALFGSLMTYLRVPVLAHVLVAVAFIAWCATVGVRAFLPDEAERHEDHAGQRSAWLEPRTLAIGLVVLIAAFTEGTANDWIAVAFVEGHRLPAWAGVLAFAVFLSFMTAGRLLGARILDRHGRVPVLVAFFALAAVGSVLVVFGGPWWGFVGAAIWGVGASLGFPVGMSAASDDPGRAAARLSVVAAIGYTAFLGGPPLLGLLGDHVGVLMSLLAVGVLAVPAMLAVPATREQR